MHIWSLPVIVVPSMAMMMLVLWRLLGGITALTGLTLDDIFRAGPAATGPIQDSRAKNKEAQR
jgi:hypothetical protein